MRRKLYVGRQNQIKDKLEYSDDAGATYTAVDLTAAAEVVLEVFDEPASPILTLLAASTHSSQFSLGATGIALWTPPAGTLTAAMVGDHNLRWIVQTVAGTGGEVYEAIPITIRP